MSQACSEVTDPIEEKCLRVLLVEHDVKYLNHMKQMLELHSCTVTPMAIASVAMSLFHSAKFEYDVIIIPIDMPGLDVFKFMEKTMSKQIPVIVTSWIEDTSLRLKAVNHGAWFFFQKPIPDDDFANLWMHVYHYEVVKEKRRKLNSEYQSIPWDTPNAVPLALARMEDMGTQKKERYIEGICNQSMGSVNSTNQTPKGFFPLIINEMGLNTIEQILERKSGKIQENSCWNMLPTTCTQELENSPKMMNNSSSLLGNQIKEEQVNTEKLTTFNHESNNEDMFFFGNEEVPNNHSGKMVGQDERDDEIQNYEDNGQSGNMPPGDVALGSNIVEQGEGFSIFEGEFNVSFEDFFELQFEDEMETFFNSLGDII